MPTSLAPSPEFLRARARERILEVDRFIDAMAEKYHVRAAVIRRIIRVESGGDPRAKGKAGEIGLMQLMPDTVRALGLTDPWEPKANIEAGVRWLAGKLRQFHGDEAKALTAYNGSPSYLRHFRDLLTGPAEVGGRAAGPLAEVLREPRRGPVLAQGSEPRRSVGLPPRAEVSSPYPPLPTDRDYGVLRALTRRAMQELFPHVPATQWSRDILGDEVRRAQLNVRVRELYWKDRVGQAPALPPPVVARAARTPAQPSPELPTAPPSVGQRLAGAFRDLLPALPALALGFGALRGKGGPRRPPELPTRELPGMPPRPEVTRGTEPALTAEPEWSKRARQLDLPGTPRPEMPRTQIAKAAQQPVETLPLFSRVREALQKRVESMQTRLFGSPARPFEPERVPAVRDFRETVARVEPRLTELERRAGEKPTEGVTPPALTQIELPKPRPVEDIRAPVLEGQRLTQPLAELPPRTLDTMGEAIAQTSPSGRLSKRALEAGQERLRVSLFGEQGLPRPRATQPTEAEALRRQAAELRNLAERGMKPQAFVRRAEQLEQRAAQIEARGTVAEPVAQRLGVGTASEVEHAQRAQKASVDHLRQARAGAPANSAEAERLTAQIAQAERRYEEGYQQAAKDLGEQVAQSIRQAVEGRLPLRGGPLAALAPPLPLPGPSDDEKRPWVRGLERAAQVAGMALPLLGLAALRGGGKGRPPIARPGGAKAFRPPEVLPQYRRESIRPLEPPATGETGGTGRETGRSSPLGTLGPSPKPGVRSRGDIPLQGPLDPPFAGGGGRGGGPRPPGSALFDPDVPPHRPLQQGYFDRLKRVLQRQRERLPAELRVLTRIPDSPVISVIERDHIGLERDLEHVLTAPFHKATHAYDAEEWKVFEHGAVTAWIKGGQTPEAYARAVSALPIEFQQQLRFRQDRFLGDQSARATLGLDPIPEQPGPYFARLTDAEYRDVVNVLGTNRGLAADLQQTVKSFQRERTQTTMLAGQAEGIEYEDPRLAWLLREWNSIKLQRTAQLMKDLSGTVIFKARDEAVAAARAYPGAMPGRIEGLPGNQETWWVRSREERNLLHQNLVHTAPSIEIFGIGNATHVMNQLFRNPNLYNPLPHFLKNMLYKYGLSGGRPRVFADMAEYWKGTDPELRREFSRVMPFTRTGRTAQDLLREAIGRNPAEKVAQLVGRVNRFSSRAIFAELDPALRYARYKQYRDAGLGPQAAANHVWVDLIRYGTRSELVDAMKAIPGNFFVSWRVGTVTSLLKQVRSHPIRAALFVTGVDLIREAYHRHTGNWLHLPIDYVEGPLSLAIDHPATIPFIAATTALFGPGGAYGATTLIDMLNTVRGTEDWTRLANLFWGFSQVLEVPKEITAMSQDADPTHVANIVTGLAFGTHTALSYRPRRLGAYLPEWIPGLQKSEIVRAAEAMQDIKTAKKGLSDVRKAAREAARPSGLTTEQQQLEPLGRGAGVLPRRSRPVTPEEIAATRRYRETVHGLSPELRRRVLQELGR